MRLPFQRMAQTLSQQRKFSSAKSTPPTMPFVPWTPTRRHPPAVDLAPSTVAGGPCPVHRRQRAALQAGDRQAIDPLYRSESGRV